MKSLLTIFFFLLIPLLVLGQIPENNDPIKPTYDPGAMSDLYMPLGNYKVRLFTELGTEQIFSSARLTYFGDKERTPLRYSGFFNVNYTNHFEFGTNFGLYVGLGFRNLGFIHHTDSFKYKYRTYNLFVPFGIKVGGLRHGHFFNFGGEINYAFNYREKKFVKRNDKEKYNEFGSDAIPNLQLMVFAGGRIKFFGIKFGYVFNNYFNPNYVRDGKKPHAGFDARLMFLAITFDINATSVSTSYNAHSPIGYYKEFK